MDKELKQLHELLLEEEKLNAALAIISAKKRDLKATIQKKMTTDSLSTNFCSITRTKRYSFEIVNEEQATDFMKVTMSIDITKARKAAEVNGEVPGLKFTVIEELYIRRKNED